MQRYRETGYTMPAETGYRVSAGEEQRVVTTIRDVAQQAGVSVATASRALNGLSNVTPLLRERVEAAARELAYVPHSGARSLTMRRTNSIGVVLPDLFGEFFSEQIGRAHV